MANKIQNLYVCSNCDAQFSKWNGRCLECGSWGTLKLQTVEDNKDKKIEISAAETISLSSIEEKNIERIVTGISELDQVLGGGIVPGSLVLLSGEPGIGKSTIVAQVALSISSNQKSVFYVSGEESAVQLKSRFDRLNGEPKNIECIIENNTERIIGAIEKNNPSLVIIDSIQTLVSYSADSEAGNISQIRASTVKLLETAKEKNIPIILIGHITKDGAIAGPKSLEHIVDTVIYLETETTHNYRVLRAIKNRFGSINELGIFEMTSQGFKEIDNPSAIFINTRDQEITGSAISCIIEGTRPFLVEVQALVTKTIFGYPQRKTSGFDLNRLQVLCAVLIKRGEINLTNQDVILNIAGGVRISDPALDLAVCLAIVSSLLNQKNDRDTIILGEVGLGGEIRNISKLEERIREAKKIGFKKAIVPNTDLKEKGIELIRLKNIKELMEIMK
jgi:DNA repair protein RadA/Sms